jgi:Rieske Fe-S protein
MSESDKYPEDSGRRRFVKGVVGGAALAGVGAAGATTINSATSSSGAGGGSTQAWAIENTDGPAPRGMPVIPVELDGEGNVRGVWPEASSTTQNGVSIQVAEIEDYKGSGTTYSTEWYQYCGVESYEGVQPAYDGDNYFRSGTSPAYTWQQEELSQGEQLNIEHFQDYREWGNGIGTPGIGKPATGTWRSQDTEDTMPIQVIRSPIVEEIANGERDVSDQVQAWVSASTQDGFIAWLNKCTHFCCVPGWKQSASAATFGDADQVYCQCHQSLYDPFSLVRTLFTARPRPD